MSAYVYERRLTPKGNPNSGMDEKSFYVLHIIPVIGPSCYGRRSTQLRARTPPKAQSLAHSPNGTARLPSPTARISVQALAGLLRRLRGMPHRSTECPP